MYAVVVSVGRYWSDHAHVSSGLFAHFAAMTQHHPDAPNPQLKPRKGPQKHSRERIRDSRQSILLRSGMSCDRGFFHLSRYLVSRCVVSYLTTLRSRLRSNVLTWFETPFHVLFDMYNHADQPCTLMAALSLPPGALCVHSCVSLSGNVRATPSSFAPLVLPSAPRLAILAEADTMWSQGILSGQDKTRHTRPALSPSLSDAHHALTDSSRQLLPPRCIAW